MLGSLFIGQTVETIAQALTAAGIAAGADDTGAVAVLGQPRVGRALRELGYRVIVIAEKRKSLRRMGGECAYGRLDALPLAQGGLAGLIGFEVGTSDDWQPLLCGWLRAVRNDGVVVLVDRASPSELTRRALCCGLLDIEQRQTGRTFITSGLVARIEVSAQNFASGEV